MSGTIDTPGIYTDLTEIDYHADPVKGGSLSSTGCRLILRSPAHYRAAQQHPEYKDVFDFGSAAHRLVTGSGSGVVVIDADDWRKKDTQTARDEARAQGLTAVLRKHWMVVEQMAAALRSHPVAVALLERDGTRETTVVWQETDSVWGRCRVDLFPTITEDQERAVIADYKTAADAETRKFEKSAADYGYMQQADWYCRGVQAVLGIPTRMVFVVQEKSPPFAVNVVELAGSFTEIGRARNDRAVHVYARCKATDTWPAYGDTISQAVPPVWLTYAHEDEFALWQTQS